jgi:hypothetical protein
MAVGTASGLLRHRRTGKNDHWPVLIARWSLMFLFAGLVVSLIKALS